MAVLVISLGLLIALPVWQTEVRREKEEELIFRGKQYAEGVRLYVQKNPGKFPASLKELLDKKCIRRLYRDPFDPDGLWNVILASGKAPSGRESAQELLVAPERALPGIKNPQILGVVSTSTDKVGQDLQRPGEPRQVAFLLRPGSQETPQDLLLRREGLKTAPAVRSAGSGARSGPAATVLSSSPSSSGARERAPEGPSQRG